MENIKREDENKFDKENQQRSEMNLKGPLDETLSLKKKSLILILEDQESVIRLYKRAFKDFNCKFVTSLREANEEFEQLKASGTEPFILIADFHLPDGESTEFVNKVKETFPKTKVILSSSDSDAESIVKHDAAFKKGDVFKMLDKINEFLKQ